MNVLFIGMGTMGSPMAINLAKTHNVSVWNRTQSSSLLKQAIKGRCKNIKSLDSDLSSFNVVILCLPDSPHIKTLLFNEGGIAKSLQPNTIIIDCSTIGPSAAKEIAVELAGLGLTYVDAPVSGGDIGAKNASLTFFVGCEKDVLGQISPLLTSMGKNIFHCGSLGAGQAIKLVNQQLCAINMVSISEAYLLSKSLGIDFKKVSEFCSSGAAGSWALENLGGLIAEKDVSPGFKTSLMLKDLSLVRREVENKSLKGLELAIKKFSEIPKDHSTVGTHAMFMAYVNHED